MLPPYAGAFTDEMVLFVLVKPATPDELNVLKSSSTTVQPGPVLAVVKVSADVQAETVAHAVAWLPAAKTIAAIAE